MQTRGDSIIAVELDKLLDSNMMQTQLPWYHILEKAVYGTERRCF